MLSFGIPVFRDPLSSVSRPSTSRGLEIIVPLRLRSLDISKNRAKIRKILDMCKFLPNIFCFFLVFAPFYAF